MPRVLLTGPHCPDRGVFAGLGSTSTRESCRWKDGKPAHPSGRHAVVSNDRTGGDGSFDPIQMKYETTGLIFDYNRKWNRQIRKFTVHADDYMGRISWNS